MSEGTREIVLAGQVSGTRNGKDWPGPGTRLELPNSEADGLVKGLMAYEVDDDRVQHLGNGNGGERFADEILAGAPTARDWTEGQADTNLARARALALDERDTREVTRAAAERAGLDDAHTIPSADPNRPIVGDDHPNPTDAPSLVALPQEVDVTGDSTPDDGAKLVEDNRTEAQPVESASVNPDAGTERADVSTKPSGRKVTGK
jgi:hypothetical protein